MQYRPCVRCDLMISGEASRSSETTEKSNGAEGFGIEKVIGSMLLNLFCMQEAHLHDF